MNRLEKTCLGGLISLPLVVSTIALGFLNTPPSISCHSVDKQAAVSDRLHCAQQQAERQTPESLIAAIDLLTDVPADDPYYGQSKRLVERLSIELFAKAEVEFQAGDLEKAVSMMRALPEDAKIKAWKSTWEKGEAVMKTALSQVEKREWKQAFQTANQLRQLENEYWATEQYDSLTRQIQSDREMRDWNYRNSVEPQKKPKEPEFIAPPLPEVAQSPENDASIFRSVSAVPEFPKLQPVSKPQPEAEIEPEPPIETLEPITETQPEPVQDASERD
jgi:chaperonin cofactor prefoldin